MGLDNSITSPHRRTQGPFSSPSFKKFGQSDVNCSALVKRHRFLLTAMVLLAILCTVYLYFAVTLGYDETCSGLMGVERESCRLKHVKATLTHGKLKLF